MTSIPNSQSEGDLPFRSSSNDQFDARSCDFPVVKCKNWMCIRLHIASRLSRELRLAYLRTLEGKYLLESYYYQVLTNIQHVPFRDDGIAELDVSPAQIRVQGSLVAI